MFGKSSEKSRYIEESDQESEASSPPSEGEGGNNPKSGTKSEKKGKKKISRRLTPSTRYPDAEIKDIHLKDEYLSCPCCGAGMKDTNMADITEKVTFIPAQYYIERIHHHKYRCTSCPDGIKSVPALPSIIPGGSYSDDLIIDVAVNKFDYLIPIQRYARIIKENGMMDLPPHSLIEQTHHLAFYLSGIYHQIKEEVLLKRIVFADETTHNQLEDPDKKQWYLWEFSSETACYFECHNSRSGQMAGELLKDSNVIYLMSDVYSGYKRAKNDCNKYRKECNLPLLLSLYCNAHSRRYFKNSLGRAPEAMYFINRYKEVYQLFNYCHQSTSKNRNRKFRRKIKNILIKMKRKAEKLLNQYPNTNKMFIACQYFVNNFEGLVRFTESRNLPIDNNHAERLFRSPVVGRKTWLGTHSERGSETAAILFSIIQSCKLNKINPRDYIKYAVTELHQNKRPKTPHQYSLATSRPCEQERDFQQIAC